MNKIELDIKALSLNCYYRIMRGRYIISPKGREYKKIITEKLNDLKIIPTNNKISLLVNCFFKGNRRRDIDNVCKGLFDTLKGHIYVDDSQIYELRLIKNNNSEFDKIIIEWNEL